MLSCAGCNPNSEEYFKKQKSRYVAAFGKREGLWQQITDIFVQNNTTIQTRFIDGKSQTSDISAHQVKLILPTEETLDYGSYFICQPKDGNLAQSPPIVTNYYSSTKTNVKGFKKGLSHAQGYIDCEVEADAKAVTHLFCTTGKCRL